MKKGFLGGFLTCALVMALISTAFAAHSRTDTLYFRDIKLMVNGELVEVTDSTGAKIEPFIINGTTYLPVGNVAKMVGYDVKWDGETSTVILELPATVSGGGQAEKLASALGAIGIDVDNLTESEISRIARLAKAALEE